MFVNDIHCIAVKREHGIQYFKLLLSILTIPFYDVAALAKLELINRSNYEGVGKTNCTRCSFHEQIKYTLDPTTNTAWYKLVYKPVKVLDKILLMPMKQDILGNMDLWCYDSDTQEVVIVFRNDEENFRIFDSMWIVNMFASDIDKLFRHDIFYEDKDAHQALRFQSIACFCYYRGIHAGSSWSEADH
ncbi:hypothetical protein Hanom_Chr16g01506611 [Helianthus anomalus]